ncbi:MAG: TonB-dependent receptor plug domain-containing protein, partial [Limisphaerales bacterium]
YRSTFLGPYDGAGFGLPGQTVFNKDTAAADWLDGEVRLSAQLWEKHLITLGGDFRHDLNIRQESFNVEPFSVTADVRSHNDNAGLYAQDEFSICTNLILNAGERYDYFESFGGTVNPRAALIYSPFAATTLKAIYGQAFRAPNAYEQDYQFPGPNGYLPNPDLRPEQIRSYELVWEQTLGEHWRLTTDAFYNDIKDLITQVYDPNLEAYIFRNTDQVDARGVELEAAGQWKSGFRGSASYSFVEAYEQSATLSRQPLVNSPKHLGKLQISLPVWPEHVLASFDAQATSGRRTLAGSVPGFVTLNFTLLSYRIVKGLEASVSVYNLLNQSYRDPVAADLSPLDSVEQDGRSFRFKLTYRF